MQKFVKAALLAAPLALAACASGGPAAPIPAASAAAPAVADAAPPSPPGAAGGDSAATGVAVFNRGGPDQLVVSFARGGAVLTPQAQAQLDTAARTYRDGHPIMMYVAGFTDRQGGELTNLLVAARRAQAVKAGLVARGIPADRLELAALGETDPAVPTPIGVSEPANRRVVITWK